MRKAVGVGAGRGTVWSHPGGQRSGSMRITRQVSAMRHDPPGEPATFQLNLHTEDGELQVIEMDEATAREVIRTLVFNLPWHSG